MGKLREVLGADEMMRAGGHWRADHVREHYELTERALAEVVALIKEGKIRTNPAAALEDLIKRWL